MGKLQASRRGGPPYRAVWSIEEGKQDGLPAQLPALVLLSKCPPKFAATISVQATLGFSMNPRRWPMFDNPDEPLHFAVGVEKGAEINRVFDQLDLAALYEDKLQGFSKSGA